MKFSQLNNNICTNHICTYIHTCVHTHTHAHTYAYLYNLQWTLPWRQNDWLFNVNMWSKDLSSKIYCYIIIIIITINAIVDLNDLGTVEKNYKFNSLNVLFHQISFTIISLVACFQVLPDNADTM